MIGWRAWLVLTVVFLSAGCGEYEEIEREVGYRGKARLDPWLAAERFAGEYGYGVDAPKSWRNPGSEVTVWFVPASVLGNESYVESAEEWAGNGGHLVVLLDNAGSDVNDWSGFGGELDVEEPLKEMLARQGIVLTQPARAEKSRDSTIQDVKFLGHAYRVDAGSGTEVRTTKGKPGVLASVRAGAGRITAVTDARIFRNRWIGDEQHAALLLALFNARHGEGDIWFSRGSSLSLWEMVKRHLWAVMLGIAAALAVWLWKNLTRFGPMEAAEAPSPVRDYDHQLEAVGSFHWRGDRAQALLAPLRERTREQSLRICGRAGRDPAGLHEWLAARAGIPVERVALALDPTPPADAATLTRITADLQTLYQHLH